MEVFFVIIRSRKTIILDLEFQDFNYINNKFLALYMRCFSPLLISKVLSITSINDHVVLINN